MAPKVKYTREEIIIAAVGIVRKKGVSSLTAREVASALGVSTRPIFTYYDSMDALKSEVYDYAKQVYKDRIELGLAEPLPFLGVWHRYLAFAREEPQLYRLLFLTPPDCGSCGAVEALAFSQSLARESIMRVYGFDPDTADCFFRDIWLVAFSFATLVVTGNCPYTDKEIFDIGAEVSLSVCKAYKDIPGLPRGEYDKDAIFRSIVAKREDK